MKFMAKTIIITGAGQGIGAALAREFSHRGANVVVTDIDLAKAQVVAGEINGTAFYCDVTQESDIQRIVMQVRNTIAPVDIFVSNAGICRGEPDHAASASNTNWQACWDIHVMAHVYACRAILPDMKKRKSGYLVQVASAAGLLNQIGDAAYSATKHAAVGFSEALAITHKDDGINVSVICPQYVATPMLGYDEPNAAEGFPGVISPKALACHVADDMQAERFMILPHPDVAGFMEFKASNYEKWLGSMRKLRRKIIAKLGNSSFIEMHKWI